MEGIQSHIILKWKKSTVRVILTLSRPECLSSNESDSVRLINFYRFFLLDALYPPHHDQASCNSMPKNFN